MHSWDKSLVKQMSAELFKQVTPFSLFLSGGEALGKSHLIKTVFHSVSKVLLY